MSVFRTPDERFDNLPGYDFEPHYLTLDGPDGEELRTHYVDTAPAGENTSPVVCLHGEPTWSYMYRDVIRPLAGSHRVVAPDFVGFGKSDKLTSQGAYSLEFGMNQVHALLEDLDVADVTLVVHDWGGLIGLAYAAHYPERIGRLVILNTFLPLGEDEEKSRGFLAWRRFVERNPDLPVGTVVERSIQHDAAWSEEVKASYDAPFPTKESKAGAAVWPLLVPMSTDDPVAQTMRRTRERLARWSKPALVLFAPDDPILGGAHSFFRSLIPTASNQPEILLPDTGHFVPEERGEAVAQHIQDFVERTRTTNETTEPSFPNKPN
ncbi:haloalkane dehalogenase [Longibacter salinarum]|uniref:Haloalkane dehalogenase n=1 Tax=Longibacter salinarum TaxID=1850348 RepID=A0A2A8CTU4_9BACT|nr:haloalkane dehalogenase [Longibacter salinarum]PEN11122.1 haloalkane dehalogenase [Longibacter salinarum]